jgi:hypothetical protein
LYGIDFISPDTGFACGNNGTLLKTYDGGLNWTLTPSGTSYQLLSIFFTDSNNGFSCGGNGSINTGVVLKTSDGGLSWTQTSFSGYFGCVRFLNNNLGYLSGGDVPSNTSIIMKTIDGGDTWTAESSPGARQYYLSLCLDGSGYACGLNGSVLKITELLSHNEEIDADNVIIAFPNPAVDKFTVKCNSETPIDCISIFDMSGKLVKHVPDVDNSSVTLDALLPPGQYNIRVESHDWQRTKKITILK